MFNWWDNFLNSFIDYVSSISFLTNFSKDNYKYLMTMKMDVIKIVFLIIGCVLIMFGEKVFLSNPASVIGFSWIIFIYVLSLPSYYPSLMSNLYYNT